MKNICSKRNLWCECKQCREYWQRLQENEREKTKRKSKVVTKEHDDESEKDLDKLFEKDGW